MVIAPDTMTTALVRSSVSLSASQPILRIQNPIRKFWDENGLLLTIRSLDVNSSLVLNPSKIWNVADFTGVEAVVIFLGKNDIPIPDSDPRTLVRAIEKYCEFLLNISGVSRTEILFGGFSFLGDRAFNHGQSFFNRLSMEKAVHLFQLSNRKIHMVDLVSSPGGSSAWFENGAMVPAWEAVVNAGIIYSVKHILNKVGDTNCFNQNPPP